MQQKIGFIGTGNMAGAMIKGLTNKFSEIYKHVYVTDKNLKKAEDMCKELHINLCENNIEIIKKAKILIIAVKPNVYGDVLQEIKDVITKEHIIVSIAAGISIKYIEGFFSQPIKIIRTMPNTPAFVGEGMTAITPNKEVTDEELDTVLSIFESIGKTDVIDEKLMDTVTAISGSSPAYVYLFIEALADGGVLQGLSREKAYTYAAQAVLGAAKMVLETGKHPGELKDNVCSPGGTTIEAVYTLEKNHFRGTIIEAMEACTEKARKMANNK
ncbi:pyrroline-5-carboxylate reductase [Clostridium formicaceticum]|uniref:Pyrroline-5-carboxylate reductase n=1 Tax=Clostridium formicaceticum TaxID=1497 RepID=A0AAC9RIU9_9CLOT|nr:pyrroline-5-carboxylate reductase [Clostridium formicaceticum]AOY75949.1 pyrroline-5-carboxylate reductase [Clostridium formicaceticum]ARE86297.1 Pyrroline-5-carboxylate reductase [Clostridium formicaceticum]